MLPKDPSGGQLAPTAVAYIVYDADGKLEYFNDRLSQLFPVFSERDMVGLTRAEVRTIIREQEPGTSEAIAQLDNITGQNKPLSANHGVFDLGEDRYCAFDELPMPDGGLVTLVRDLSEKKRSLDSIARMEAAISKLANEEAIYNGTKDRAYEIMTEVACGALEAARTDVWLMNVDGTALYPQESYWAPDKEHAELERLDRAGHEPFFEALELGAPLNVPDIRHEPCLVGFHPADERERAIKSLLVVPITRGPRTVGAILVAENREFRAWSSSEIAFVSYLCDLILRMLEAHDRQVAEEGLRGFNEMLEMKVKKRTRDLEEAMETLKMAQEELVRSEKMASLGGLVAGVAHEINTPLGVALTSITHMAEAFDEFKRAVDSGKIRKSDLTNFMETADEGTLVVRRNLDRAAHLIRSFKMVAVDQSADDMRELDIGVYLDEIVESLIPTLRKKGVKVAAASKGDLAMKTVPGDLSHILTNLIMNATLHAFTEKAEGEERKIDVSAKRLKASVQIEVADNGRGIPDDIREKIFEPFFTTARNSGGSGLGLNIVYNTVYQKLGGKIDVKEAKGGGTRFVINLPVDQ